MNKEVIYLEPEDDITDILTKLQQAEQKLVALVPPKKATMLRSAVNMKLVARVAKECEKVVVVVTADPAILKMAMMARIPVARTLSSRPIIPTEENIRAAGITPNDERIIDEAEVETAPEVAPSASGEFISGKAEPLEFDEDSLVAASDAAKGGKNKDKKDKKPKKDKTGNGDKKILGLPLDKFRKYCLIAVPVVLIITVGLVWAFVFAPAASVSVTISSSSTNISENIRFTTEKGEEDAENGLLFASKETLEQKYTADFTAKDEENKGKHSSGQVSLTLSFKPSSIADPENDLKTFYVPQGTEISTTAGQKYTLTEKASLNWDGTYKGCTVPPAGPSDTCKIVATVNIEAVEAGDDYDLSTGAKWATHTEDGHEIVISNPSAISGGTTDMVKVVSQEDLDKAAEAEIKSHESDGKKYLLEDIGEGYVAIGGSFAATAKESTSSPAVGEAVDKDGAASAHITVEYSIYVVSRESLETYLKAKTELATDQKIYSIGNPYFERYTEITEGARLKTVIETGPIVSEDAIFDKIAGRKTGEVNALLRSVSGISSVEVRTSYFWVWSIPTDREKVSINLSGEGTDQ